MSIHEFMRSYHPFIAARDAFVAGNLTTTQAISMCASDRDWIAECELSGFCPVEKARAVVTDVWRKELVARIQRDKALAVSARY